MRDLSIRSERDDSMEGSELARPAQLNCCMVGQVLGVLLSLYYRQHRSPIYYGSLGRGRPKLGVEEGCSKLDVEVSSYPRRGLAAAAVGWGRPFGAIWAAEVATEQCFQSQGYQCFRVSKCSLTTPRISTKFTGSRNGARARTRVVSPGIISRGAAASEGRSSTWSRSITRSSSKSQHRNVEAGTARRGTTAPAA